MATLEKQDGLHPECGLDVETDDTIGTLRGYERFNSLVMRLSETAWQVPSRSENGLRQQGKETGLVSSWWLGVGPEGGFLHMFTISSQSRRRELAGFLIRRGRGES